MLVIYTTAALCCERMLPNDDDILTVQHPGAASGHDCCYASRSALSFISLWSS